MTIKTFADVGEYICINGQQKKVLGIHIYESRGKHTERYYFGNGEWATFQFNKNESQQKG